MKKPSNYSQGGDAQAIKQVTERYYGSLKNLFVANDWPERGAEMMTAAPRRIVETYGSIHEFETLHQSSGVMFPMEAIYSDPPNVWLTSFYGFGPEEWGYVGFTEEGKRASFINRSKPGVLVVVYGSGKAPKAELQKVLGIVQCSHEIGHAKIFSSPAAWAAKERDPDSKGKWNYAVKITRAWRISPESRIGVREFAPVATATEAWQHIGAQGEPLTRPEALNILRFDLKEVQPYGALPILDSSMAPAIRVLAPSKAGPVSQNPHMTKEAEGPKHLYVLKLNGDTDAFLGKPANGRVIIKAGFSVSPETRKEDHNRTLPECAYKWEILLSGPKSGFAPYPTSDHAKAGERAMQIELCTLPDGGSLGGEFFLATHELIERAWQCGNKAAKEFSK